MKDTKFDKKLIQKIFEKYKLDKIKKITYSKSGAVNPCLFINDNYVMRVNVRDPQLLKFQKEKIAYDLLKDTIVPVPKIIVLDESKEIIPYTYMIMTRIIGKELEKNWKNISEKQRIKIAYKFGHLLAEIHKIKFSKFGDFTGNKSRNFKYWDQYLINGIKERLLKCKNLKIYEDKLIKKIISLFESEKYLFRKVNESVLVHNDYFFDNLIYYKNNPSGVIDFEWAIAGDSEFDLKNLDYSFNKSPGSKIPFMKGYTSISPLSKDFELKKLFYKLFIGVDLAVVSKVHWDKKSYNRIRKEIFPIIKEIEKALKNKYLNENSNIIIN
ncbi:aminoglycoside phosphotransferase family protein [Candidatus Pacearchaeota archaeon]|nr:aminoglycoside phosphotransferase family protein [Candidatus Pacearchaeota archaeon]